MTTLAIIQSIPTHPGFVVRTDSFAKFQQICGMIESTSYLAGHASCHASMNGIERTMTADADIHDKDSITNALKMLFDADPFDALVIPGLTDFELQKHICSICQSRDPNFTVFLDADRQADMDTIIAHQQAVPRFARFAWPWISTVTPGRRSAEWLPASCVIAPLFLGKARYLRGVHDLSGLKPADIAKLSKNDVELLVHKTDNRRPVIGRYISEQPVIQPIKQAFVEVPGVFAKNTENEEKPQDPNEVSFENALAEELHRRCDELIRQYAVNGPELWSALQRTAFAVLNEAKSRGNIVRFHVRCDAETASWGTPEKPVVEVLIEYPKRVKEIKFNWA